MKDENHQLPKTPSTKYVRKTNKVYKTKTGRPTKFSPLQLKQIKKLTEIGSTDFEIPEFLGIDEKTYINWKQSRPDFFQLITEAKEIADQNVELSLYKKATGTTRRKQVLNSDDEPVWLIEEIPPSDFAAFTWLKNRRKDRWTDRQEVEHSGEIKHIAVTVQEKTKTITQQIEDKNTIEHEDNSD